MIFLRVFCLLAGLSLCDSDQVLFFCVRMPEPMHSQRRLPIHWNHFCPMAGHKSFDPMLDILGLFPVADEEFTAGTGHLQHRL